VIMMPEGKDPADIVLENKNEWEKCIKDAKPVINFYFNNVLSKYDLSDAHEKGKAGKEIIPEIKKIKNSIERSHFVGELSRALGVSESSIYEEMEKTKENRSEIRENKIKEVKERTRKDLLEEKIACFCIKNEDLLKKIEDKDIDLLKEEIKNIFSFLRKEKESIKEEEEDLLNYLSLLPYDEDVSKEEEFLNCLKEMKKESIKGKLQKTEEMIKEAERSGDEKKEEELIKKFQEYSKELQSL
jgi:DNA primase